MRFPCPPSAFACARYKLTSIQRRRYLGCIVFWPCGECRLSIICSVVNPPHGYPPLNSMSALAEEGHQRQRRRRRRMGSRYPQMVGPWPLMTFTDTHIPTANFWDHNLLRRSRTPPRSPSHTHNRHILYRPTACSETSCRLHFFHDVVVNRSVPLTTDYSIFVVCQSPFCSRCMYTHNIYIVFRNLSWELGDLDQYRIQFAPMPCDPVSSYVVQYRDDLRYIALSRIS